MTSKIKCPVCQKATLVRLVNPLTGEEYADYHCPNFLCNFSGNEVAVNALNYANDAIKTLTQPTHDNSEKANSGEHKEQI